jgi:hypothetical protein
VATGLRNTVTTEMVNDKGSATENN